MRRSFIKIFSSFFSDTRQLPKLTREALEAIWAEEIFHRISDEKILQVQQPIMDYIPQILKTEKIREHWILNEEDVIEAKNNILKATSIQNGVILPSELIKTQERFMSGQKERKIVFYPNHYTTHFIFNWTRRVMKGINNQKRSLKLLTVGKQGISKSFGYLYAWYLINIVINFRYNNPEISNKLFEQNLLEKNTQKIIYVSLKAENTSEQIFDVLMSQCPQLQTKIMKSIDLLIKKIQDPGQIPEKKFKKICRLIPTLYKLKNISCMIVIDQINILARIFRQYANQIKQKQGEQIINVYENNFIYQNIKLIGEGKIYNSSTNIQPQILGHQSSKFRFTLNLNSHDKIKIADCQYQKTKFSNQIYLKQLYRTIWYEFSKKLTSEQIIKYRFEAVKICDELAIQNKFISFITPLSIRQKVEGIKINDKKIQNLQQLKSHLTDILIDIKQKGINLLKQKSFKYFTSENRQVNQISLALSFVCSFYISSYSRQNCTQLTIPYQFLIKSGIQKHWIQMYSNKDIFVPLQDQKIVKMIISEAELKEIELSQIIYEGKYLNRISQIVKGVCNLALIGMQVQQKILYLLNVSPKCKFNLNYGPNQVAYEIQSTKNTFYHFNSSKTTVSNNLKDVLQKAKSPEFINKKLLATPVNKQQKHSLNSSCFDFLVVQNVESGFNIYSFDITVGNQQIGIESKCASAHKLITRLLKANKSEKDKILLWKHTIVCRPTFYITQPKVPQKVVIVLADIFSNEFYPNLYIVPPQKVNLIQFHNNKNELRLLLEKSKRVQ